MKIINAIYMKNRLYYPIFALLLFVVVMGVIAATGSISTTYNYKAKEMVSDRKTGITVFKGDAKIDKKSEDPKVAGDHMYADQITIYQDVENKNELIKIDAVGNVDIKEGDMTALCAHAIIYETEERIEMEGSPAIVNDVNNKIEAPSITFFRKDNRLEAKGNVSGHIIIEEKEKTEEKGQETKDK